MCVRAHALCQSLGLVLLPGPGSHGGCHNMSLTFSLASWSEWELEWEGASSQPQRKFNSELAQMASLHTRPISVAKRITILMVHAHLCSRVWDGVLSSRDRLQTQICQAPSFVLHLEFTLLSGPTRMLYCSVRSPGVYQL